MRCDARTIEQDVDAAGFVHDLLNRIRIGHVKLSRSKIRYFGR